MRNAEQRIGKVIQSIPQVPENLVVSDRWAATVLAREARRNDAPTPDFKIVGFRNTLRSEYDRKLSVTLSKTYPLNDFLLHFLETTRAMGVEQPILCREWTDIIEAARHFEEAYDEGTPDETSPEYEQFKEKSEQKAEKERQEYLKRECEYIVEYENPAPFGSYNSSIREGCFIEAEKNGRRIMLTPTDKPIGDFSPTILLEAYLLYLLDGKQPG